MTMFVFAVSFDSFFGKEFGDRDVEHFSIHTCGFILIPVLTVESMLQIFAKTPHI